MQELSLREYQHLTCQATPLSIEIVDGHTCHKVLQLQDGSIMKLFRIKRLLSSARIVPPAKRFQRNVERLQSHGIPTVALQAVYDIPSMARTAVHYRYLGGITLRDVCAKDALTPQLAHRLGTFFASLHQKGIYFRSIHFGNMVLTTPDHRIGLIDVLDMRFRRGPLNRFLRRRNLRHLFRYGIDIDCLAPVRDSFFDAYRTSSRLRPGSEKTLRSHFEAYFRSGKRRSPAEV